MTWERGAAAVTTVAPQVVWDVLLDGPRWGAWNPDVEWLWLEGEPAPGTLATIKLRRLRQTALVIEEALAPQRFALALTVGPVARLEVRWTLAAHPAGTQIGAKIAVAGIAGGLLLKRSAERVARALPDHLERLAARSLVVEKKDARLD